MCAMLQLYPVDDWCISKRGCRRRPIDPGIMEERRSYEPGTFIWVPDPDTVWRKAEVLESCSNDGSLKLRYEDTAEEFDLCHNEPTHLCNTDAFTSEGLMGLDDLTQLTHLHEPAVLHSLNLRFDVDQIYTFTGPILLAVNPFKTIPKLYSVETIQSFLRDFGIIANSSSSDAAVLASSSERVPHVFAIGAQAFRNLCRTNLSQTILISGESGAGKTESTKFVMKLLALAGSKDWNNRSQVENQVLQSNPLLEALGNAKTLRNDNSSRFGKFIEMQFELVRRRGLEFKVGQLAGARIHTYLLETVRVCHQAEGERNYHSFYQVCTAAAEAANTGGKYNFPKVISEGQPVQFDMSKYGSLSQFNYLTQSTCTKLQRMDDLEEFEATVLAMQTIGIPHEEQIAMFNVIAAVLYIGNLAFISKDKNSEGSVISPDSQDAFHKVVDLLQVDRAALEKALTHRTITARNEVYSIQLKLHEAEDFRDALAKGLYGTLFLKLVHATNNSIGYRDDVSLFCGVLDIFGFECFKLNSFEQLCINFTNERLQDFFNTFIFRCEERLYRDEDIPWTTLDFPDNKDCVDLLSGRGGVFSMLDEECIVPGGNDKAFCNKLKEKHKDHVRFSIIKPRPEWFIINHFAGPVAYCSDGFLDKNRDQLSTDLQECIKGSTVPFIQSLFKDFLNRGAPPEAGVKGKKKVVTVSGEFCNQLNYLMSTVDVTEPHFIRCLKPNSKNVPDIFERKSVTEQLRYGGVLQAVQVSRAGYPIRLKHEEALQEYSIFAEPAIKNALRNSAESAQEKVKQLMNHLNDLLKLPVPAHSPHSWAVGKTLVFLKYSAYEVLSTARSEKRRANATLIQANWKGHVARAAYQRLRLAALYIVVVCRVRHILATKIQACWKGHKQYEWYQRIRRSAIIIQATCRGFFSRVETCELFRRFSAVKIQTAWRRYAERSKYVKLRTAVCRTQRRWRCILAKRELRRLRMEQREAAHHAAKAKQLEERCKQLEEQNRELQTHCHALEEENVKYKSEINKLADEIATQTVLPITEQQPLITPPQSPPSAELLTTPPPNEGATEVASPQRTIIIETPPPGSLPIQKSSSLPFPCATCSEIKGKLEMALEENEALSLRIAQLEEKSLVVRTPPPINNVIVSHTPIIIPPEGSDSKAQIEKLTQENERLKLRVTSQAVQSPPPAGAPESVPESSAQPPERKQSMDSGKGAFGSIVSSVTRFFGAPTADVGSVPNEAREQFRVLHPSVSETTQPPSPDVKEDGQMVCVDTLPDQSNAVTCLAFGRQRMCRDHYLLAAACKDGSVSIYKVYRTAAELAAWDASHPNNGTTGTSISPEREGQAELTLKLFGHSRAITYMFFSCKEDQLVTTSIDKSVRFWNLDTGDMLKVFADSSACLVAAYLPLNPAQFLVANGNAILRVVDARDGTVLQKLRAESEIRALKFDNAGVYCYAGTRSGVLHVLESNSEGSVRFKFKNKLARASITNIVYVPQVGDHAPVLLINSCDGFITVVDCVYKNGPALSTVLVRKRMKIPQTLLPLRACYSFAGQGWIISASEDKNVHIFERGSSKLRLLKRHEAPVVTVATNDQNTLLASADALGTIHLWRWLKFSQ